MSKSLGSPEGSARLGEYVRRWAQWVGAGLVWRDDELVGRDPTSAPADGETLQRYPPGRSIAENSTGALPRRRRW